MLTVLNRTDQVAVVLYLDVAAEAAVRVVMQRLVASGLAPSTSSPVRPHLTVAVCTGLDVDQFRPALAQLAAETPTLPCTFASLGAFPTEEGVIFLAPTASQALLHLEEHVLDHLGTFGAEVSPYFRAGSWVPHCTLAIGIQRDHMAAAFGVCFEAFHPISGQLIQLALAEISTGGPGYSFDLGRASK